VAFEIHFQVSSLWWTPGWTWMLSDTSDNIYVFYIPKDSWCTYCRLNRYDKDKCNNIVIRLLVHVRIVGE
jgi:hypothetical protein